MFWLAVVVILTIVFSFMCSIWEAALYSIPPGRVEKLRQSGKARGKLLAVLRQNMDRPVSAILTLNTIAHTTGATLAGSLVQVYYGSQWLSIFSGVFVFAILVFSEIIPKTLGVCYANRLAPFFALQIQILVWALYPAVIMSEWITRLFKPKKKDAFPTEEDILSVASLGVRSGGILPEEHKWLENVLRLNNVQAKDMMTPREKILFLAAEESVGEIIEASKDWDHRHLPLFHEGDLDKPAGAVLRLDVVAAVRDGREDVKLRELAKSADVVPPSKAGHEILQEMIRKHQELFIIADAEGKTLGLVTLEDVIEEMLGMEID
ncbi:MAG: CNNM domain-containing protein [Planctomycetota bacterium]|jgi:CBS domain containing-hemolysin-like protein